MNILTTLFQCQSAIVVISKHLQFFGLYLYCEQGTNIHVIYFADIVFFGEELPDKFFICSKAVSNFVMLVPMTY